MSCSIYQNPPILICIFTSCTVLLQLYLFQFKARGKPTPTGSKLEGGPSTAPVSSAQSDESTRVKEKEREERKAAKKLKKELQNVEAQGAVPLGPLVALGKPRDKLKKRPRCDINWNNNESLFCELSPLLLLLLLSLMSTLCHCLYCLMLFVFKSVNFLLINEVTQSDWIECMYKCIVHVDEKAIINEHFIFI